MYDLCYKAIDRFVTKNLDNANNPTNRSNFNIEDFITLLSLNARIIEILEEFLSSEINLKKNNLGNRELTAEILNKVKNEYIFLSSLLNKLKKYKRLTEDNSAKIFRDRSILGFYPISYQDYQDQLLINIESYDTFLSSMGLKGSREYLRLNHLNFIYFKHVFESSLTPHSLCNKLRNVLNTPNSRIAILKKEKRYNGFIICCDNKYLNQKLKLLSENFNNAEYITKENYWAVDTSQGYEALHAFIREFDIWFDLDNFLIVSIKSLFPFVLSHADKDTYETIEFEPFTNISQNISNYSNKFVVDLLKNKYNYSPPYDIHVLGGGEINSNQQQILRTNNQHIIIKFKISEHEEFLTICDLWDKKLILSIPFNNYYSPYICESFQYSLNTTPKAFLEITNGDIDE